MPNIDVSIVTWNSAADIRGLLESLRAQTLVPQSITVVDNASQDSTLALLKAFPDVHVLAQPENTGFARGHNLGIAAGKADYVLVVNPDVRLDPTYLQTLVDFAERTPDAGALVGSVQRSDGTIDTAGLRVARSRLVRERTFAPDTPQHVFGISGAVALYRRQALQDVRVDGQIYNEAFFAYKEDVELAWRLQWAGWQAYCVPQARGQHGRVMSARTRRSQRDQHRRFLSYRNHLLLYAIAESPTTFWPDAWAILPAEIARFLYLLLTDPVTTVRALAAAGKMWHAARTFAARENRRVRSTAVRAARAL